MKKTITIKITPERKEDLLKTMEQYSSIYKAHTEWAIENKTYSKQKAHEALYFLCRNNFSELPSALIQCARDNALESVKSNKFKKTTPKKYATLRYDQRTVTLRGHQLTLSSIGKRQKTIISIPEYFKSIFDSWQFTGLQLSYRKGVFWGHLNYEKQSPDKMKNEKIIGVDRGIHNIVSTSDGDNFSGRVIRGSRRKHLYNRKNLQAKGTRSSKRRLCLLSGKEKRFSKQMNHIVSNWLLLQEADTFVLEDLSKIRKRRGKHANKRISDWSFFQLEQFLDYKADSLGKNIEFVDARYTSQKCNCCGHTAKNNRTKSLFVCKNCGYTEHADINAAKNIRDSYILSTQESRTGFSQQPECSQNYGRASNGACPRCS